MVGKDITQCSNYNGITLLSTNYKVFSAVLLGLIVPEAERIIGSQRSVSPNKSATDRIFCLWQTKKELLGYDHHQLHHVFFDF